jgi:hypothetical protein
MTRKLRRSHASAVGFGLLFLLAPLLADKAAATTLQVTTLADSGPGSLRQAVLDANAATGADTVVFGIVGTITLTSGEIKITDDLVINGLGAGVLTVSGNDQSRVFNIDNAADRTINVTLSGLTLTHGFTPGGGGVVRAERANLTVLSSVLSNGVAQIGGGLGAEHSNTTTIRFSSILGNRATSIYGGGIYSEFGNHALIIESSTIAGNSAGFEGGGIYAEVNRNVEIVNSTISGNTAGLLAGGISYYFGTYPGGGQIDNIVRIRHTTIANNTAGESGNLWGDYAADVDHSIIANGSPPVEIFGVHASYSLIEDNYLVIGDHNLIGVDPLLGPLADNGGPTLTHALLPGSPAIDAGNPAIQDPPATDQRGFARIYGPAIDIGAVEAQPLDIVNVPTLSEIGTLLLAMLLVAAGLWELRSREQRVTS